MHTALSAVYTDQGFVGGDAPAASSGDGLGAAIASPITSATSAIGLSSQHITLWGLVLFLVALWALVRVAGFRFVITTGVGVR